jgi:hypothetical protein
MSRIYGAIRNPLNTISLTDTPTRILTSLRNIGPDNTSLSETVSRIYNSLRNISSTISITSNVDRFTEALRVLTETVSQSDSVDRLSVVSRAMSVTTSLTDIVIRTYNPLRSMSDAAITISDNITGIKLVLISLRNTVQIRRIMKLTKRILRITRGTVQI